MGLMDLVQSRMTRLSTAPTDGTTLQGELVGKPDVLKRVEAMLDLFTSTQTTRLSAKGVFFLRRIVEETLDEASDFPEELIEEAMMKAAGMLFWVSTGKIPDNAAPDVIEAINAYSKKHQLAIAAESL